MPGWYVAQLSALMLDGTTRRLPALSSNERMSSLHHWGQDELLIGGNRQDGLSAEGGRAHQRAGHLSAFDGLRMSRTGREPQDAGDGQPGRRAPDVLRMSIASVDHHEPPCRQGA